MRSTLLYGSETWRLTDIKDPIELQNYHEKRSAVRIRNMEAHQYTRHQRTSPPSSEVPAVWIRNIEAHQYTRHHRPSPPSSGVPCCMDQKHGSSPIYETP
ncbi:hypothetical protein PoB_002719600 [Plakobranchus ocellatus]|uniref:Uncharacterized protein n=1 Tax=Plakobranchus ocellatus TaxID=259542 RepID=A0AAV4A1T8_9GAST|nr:hypothetical protein PoB_002719600 [Plakobranchus ocellatus]